MINPIWKKGTIPREWTITIVTDATSGQPQLEGQSVLGIEVYLMNTLIIWKSKTSNIVTLSSTEAEVQAAVEGIKAATVVKDVLEWMGLKVKLPMELYIDNLPAVNIIRNNYTTKLTKHAAIRQYYIKEQFQLGNVNPIHKRTDVLSADLMTKNLPYKDFMQKTRNVDEVPSCYREKCETIFRQGSEEVE